jgi:hypothetical protein
LRQAAATADNTFVGIRAAGIPTGSLDRSGHDAISARLSEDGLTQARGPAPRTKADTT